MSLSRERHASANQSGNITDDMALIPMFVSGLDPSYQADEPTDMLVACVPAETTHRNWKRDWIQRHTEEASLEVSDTQGTEEEAKEPENNDDRLDGFEERKERMDDVEVEVDENGVIDTTNILDMLRFLNGDHTVVTRVHPTCSKVTITASLASSQFLATEICEESNPSFDHSGQNRSVDGVKHLEESKDSSVDVKTLRLHDFDEDVVKEARRTHKICGDVVEDMDCKDMRQNDEDVETMKESASDNKDVETTDNISSATICYISSSSDISSDDESFNDSSDHSLRDDGPRSRPCNIGPDLVNIDRKSVTFSNCPVSYSRVGVPRTGTLNSGPRIIEELEATRRGAKVDNFAGVFHESNHQVGGREHLTSAFDSPAVDNSRITLVIKQQNSLLEKYTTVNKESLIYCGEATPQTQRKDLKCSANGTLASSLGGVHFSPSKYKWRSALSDGLKVKFTRLNLISKINLKSRLNLKLKLNHKLNYDVNH